MAIAVGDTYGNMKHCAHVESGWLKKAQVTIVISIPKVELMSSHDECLLIDSVVSSACVRTVNSGSGWLVNESDA